MMMVNTDDADASNGRRTDEPDSETVHRLVREAREGDEDAFGELVRLYHHRVFGVAYRFVGNADDAQELAQVTWLKAWEKLPTFKERSEFFTWVYRIATYVSLDFIRKRTRRREEPLLEERDPGREPGSGEPPSARPRPDRQLEHGEMQERFERALQELSPEHRMALVLREIEGLSYEEIARVMKCRKGTVMSRIYYARKNMQERLKDLI